MEYITRIADRQISRYLDLFGAVLVEGPKWCGKTWAARHAANSEFGVADPEGNFRNREVARLNPQVVLEGLPPHLVDEWQEVPALWDAVRHEIDRTGQKGQFILTGSSTPDDGRTIHSGTGRFGRIRLETMSMNELGIAKPGISLAELFEGTSAFDDGEYVGALTLPELIGITCKGGWPGLIEADIESATEVIDSYVDDVAEIDISRIDGVKRDPDKVKALLKSLARNTASTVRYTTISKDISEFSSVEVSDETVSDYMNLLKRLFLLRDIPAWGPALKSTVRLRVTPKRVLADASLAVSALGASVKSLAADPKLFGSLFENQVLHDLIVYANDNRAEVRHYQDNSGLEVDAIIEKRDGAWGGIEIKLGFHQEDEAAASLKRLQKKLADGGERSPAFLAVVIGVGALAKRRADGIFVIPVDSLCS
jgi:predicted AAA+ superfamily ATPase